MAYTYTEALQLAAFNNPALRFLATMCPLSIDRIRDAVAANVSQQSGLETDIETAVFGNLSDFRKPKHLITQSNAQTNKYLGSDNDGISDLPENIATAGSRFANFCPVHAKRTIIFVHGAWQTTSSLQHVAIYLRSYGYKVLTPALPSTTTRPAVPNGDCDVAAVRNCVTQEIESGRDIVLVMHSYGAAVGCEALKGISIKRPGEKEPGVLKLGFLAGWIPTLGGCLWDNNRKERWVPGMVLNEDLITIYDGIHRFYNDLPPEEAHELAAKLTMQSRPALASPLTHTTYRDIPSAYLLTTLDRALPPKLQAVMAKGAGSKVTKMKAGHVPFASEEGAKEVGKWIRKEVIGEALSKL